MFFLLSALAIGAASPPPTRDAWVEFDRRPAGWAESPYEYEAGSVRRVGARVRVTYRHKFFLSGLPDPEYRIGLELDCADRRTRIYAYAVYDGPARRRAQRSRERAPAVATAIAPGSIEESLARRLCPAAGEE